MGVGTWPVELGRSEACEKWVIFWGAKKAGWEHSTGTYGTSGERARRALSIELSGWAGGRTVWTVEDHEGPGGGNGRGGFGGLYGAVETADELKMCCGG